MNNINEWFSSGLKLKRWFFLMIVGILLLSRSIAKFMISEEIEISQLIIHMIMFVVGFNYSLYILYIDFTPCIIMSKK